MQHSVRRALWFIIVAHVCIWIPELQSQCPPGSLTFTNQSDLEEFAQNYPDCQHVNGALTITGLNSVEPVTDISALAGLTTLKFGIQILHTTELESIAALSGIDSIGAGLNINNNEKLLSLNGLQGLKEVGSIILKNNSLLQDITALSGIRSATGGLDVENNPMLTSLQGLSGIKHLTELRIFNTSLITLEGLDSLETIGAENITISLNDNLESFDGLNRLTSVGGPEFTGKIWWIEFNSKLESIEALSSLTVLNTSLFLKQNVKLKSLKGLENVMKFYGSLRFMDLRTITTLEPVKDWMHSGSELFIWDNTKLDTCAVKSICDYLKGSKFRSIRGNATNCRNEEVILEQCDMPSSVIRFSSSHIQIHPNPASDFLYVSIVNPKHIQQISLINSVGQVILMHPIDGESLTELDIRGVAPGIYCVMADGSLCGKVIVM